MFMDLAFRSNIETCDHNEQIDNLLRFLNTNIWEGGLGVTDDVEIISEHSPFDYSCQKVNILGENEKVVPSAYKRYTKFAMRRWENQKGEQKHVYVEHRLILLLFRMSVKDLFLKRKRIFTIFYLTCKKRFLNQAQ